MYKQTLLAAAAAAVFAVPVMGQLVAYDPFLVEDLNDSVDPARGDGEYTPGTDIRGQGAAALGFVGTSGVDGFAVPYSGSTSNYVPNALGEDVPEVDYEQGGRLQWLGVGNSAADRNITRQLNPTPSSATWFTSLITNRLGWADPAANVLNTYAVGGFTDASGNGLQIGYEDVAQDGVPNLTLRVNGTFTTLINNAPSSDNQFVVVGLTVNPTGDDVINVFVNPTALDGSDVAAVTLTDVNFTDSLTPFTQVKFESPGQSGPVFWDEITLGTDLASIVVPEPASLGLLAAAGLGLIRRRTA
jgi:hypothetical protein